LEFSFRTLFARAELSSQSPCRSSLASSASAQTQRRSSVMEEHPLFPASDPAPQPKRKPARPPKLPQKLAASPDPAPPAKKARTGHYTNWFSSPYINDVLQALERHSYNFKRAVDWLKQHAPDGRFQRLSDSTVRAWFEKGTHSLLPSCQHACDGPLGYYAVRSHLICSLCAFDLLRCIHR